MIFTYTKKIILLIGFFWYSLIFIVFNDLIVAQTYESSLLEDNVIIQTDRRPIHVGFYDSIANKTFVSWIGANSHPIVKVFDHTIQTWSENTIAGTSPFNDKHNYPGMLRGPDGRIYIFYGCHNSTMKMSVSQYPLSVEGTWNDKLITEAARASYPAPIITVDGIFYVFYRDTRQTNGYSDDRPYQYVKSTDIGETWTRQMAIDPYPRTTDNMCEVYNGKVKYEPPHGEQEAKIHIAWTIAGEKLGSHAHATYGRNVYYAYLNPSNDHFYNVEGNDLGAHIDNLESDKYCIVWDSGIPEKSDNNHLAALQVSATYLDNGLPIVYFSNKKVNADMVATWQDSIWLLTETGSNVGEPRDIEKFGPESFRTYCPSGNKINIYKTLNGGLNWEFETFFDVAENMSRVYVIDNFHPDVKLLLTQRPGSINAADGSVFTAKVISNYSPEYISGDGVSKPTKPDSLIATLVSGNKINLKWKDSEYERSYLLEYSLNNDTAWKALNTIGHNVKSYIVSGLPSSTYNFRIRAENSYIYSLYSNTIEITTRAANIDDDAGSPEGYIIKPAYPNPFNPSTWLSYELPVSGNVELIVYDVMGREITTLVKDFQRAGEYIYTWNTMDSKDKHISSGTILPDYKQKIMYK